MKRKILSLLLAFICAWTMCLGCGEDENKNDLKGGPKGSDMTDYEKYKDTKIMDIGAWWAPASTEDAYRLMSECGLNMIYLNGPNTGSAGDSRYPDALALCEKYGIKSIVTNGNNLAAQIRDYTANSKVTAYNFYDEPKANQYDNLASLIPAFENVYGDKASFNTNLFPIYASETQLGASSYDEYVKQYCQKVLSKLSHKKVLSTDIYPLHRSASNYSLLESWLLNLEIIAKYAKEYDAETHVFIQSMSFGRNNDRVPSEADLRLQAYVSFAFGFKSISHFCYFTPSSPEFSEAQFAIVDRDGKKTEIYDSAKKVNEEILNFDHVYLSFDWQGVIPVLGSNNRRNNAFGYLDGALSYDDLKTLSKAESDEDILIGCFEDEKGYEGYIVVNYADTTKNLTAEASLSFPGCTNAQIYRGGQKSVGALSNGKFNVTLEPGEGIFVIPYKE